MDLIDRHHLIDAIMAPAIPDDALAAHNARLQQARALGYTLRREPLYNAQGASVAKRIAVFAVEEGYQPRLLEERFYWRGMVEGTPWTPITKAQALHYTNRDGKVMAGW